MKLATFSLPPDPKPRLGIFADDHVVDLSERFPGGLVDLIRRGPAAWKEAANLGGPHHDLRQIRWHAPIPRPDKNIMCVGLNYVAHAVESAKARGREARIPDIPVFFTKAPTTVSGPFDAIPWDRAATQQVDYEVELAVLMGIAGRNLPRDRALDHVFGYTVLNDVTARDLQARHLQWFKGKSLDGFCPMGPVVVTADEFGDPHNKRIASRVNGETRQSSNTSDMIFPLGVILEFLSAGMTLEPGDIVATGTPEGVGIGRTPPVFLADGDIVEAEIEGIGTLRNRVVAV